MSSTLADLAAAVTALPTAEEVEIVDDSFVAAYIDFAPVGATVGLNVDPDFDEQEDGVRLVEVDALITATERVLALSTEHWAAILDDVADDIAAALAEDGETLEQTDLRDELELASIAVFTDAVLLGLVAHQQFPDAVIYVQLDDDLEVEDISIELDEDDEDEDDDDEDADER